MGLRRGEAARAIESRTAGFRIAEGERLMEIARTALEGRVGDAEEEVGRTLGVQVVGVAQATAGCRRVRLASREPRAHSSSVSVACWLAEKTPNR